LMWITSRPERRAARCCICGLLGSKNNFTSSTLLFC
jgi:hypothetical protein